MECGSQEKKELSVKWEGGNQLVISKHHHDALIYVYWSDNFIETRRKQHVVTGARTTLTQWVLGP